MVPGEGPGRRALWTLPGEHRLRAGGPNGAAVLTGEAREQRIDAELAEPRIAPVRGVFTHGISE
ncbi:hypothetical protein [Streptomyces sp. NPDC001770]